MGMTTLLNAHTNTINMGTDITNMDNININIVNTGFQYIRSPNTTTNTSMNTIQEVI
jgi:hypothetical protein